MDMDRDRPHFRTTSIGSSTATTATANATNELFICFTSRLSSSSSMKLSKSILSPGRVARDGGPVSLSSSLSRRLRTNGSLKGGQASPFYTTTGKKRGCAFENPEPSSPKVTCIGQVRVKTKKKVKQQSRSLSRRRSGEVSFRKIEQGISNCGDEDNNKQRQSNGGVQYQQQQAPTQECLQPHRNQRWVHFPVSICETLRTFGAEFSCLFPCSKSSCFSTGEREKGEKQSGSRGGDNENGCGAVFARWLVSVNDGEGGKRREIELVVGGGDEEEGEERVSMRRSSRRHVFEDIEVKDDRIEVKGQSVEGEAAGRVSISIPPKNALLLMRCRSDPMKMAALANRFSWDARAAPEKGDHGDGNIEEVEENEEDITEQVEEVAAQDDVSTTDPVPVEEGVPDRAEASLELETSPGEQGCLAEDHQIWEEGSVVGGEEMHEDNAKEEFLQQIVVGDEEEEKALAETEEEEDEEVESNMSSFEALLDQGNAEAEPYQCPIQDNQVEDVTICHSPASQEDIESNQMASPLNGEEETAAFGMDSENEATAEEDQTDSAGKDESISTSSVNNDEEDNGLEPHPGTPDRGGEDGGGPVEESEASTPTCEAEDDEQATPQTETETETGPPDNSNPEFATRDDEQVVLRTEKGNNAVLPECLLLMMCEPKLSMEVSKETWVCSTDFIRWLPERPRKSAKLPKACGGRDHDTAVKRRLSIDSKAKPMAENNQPPRSSCSSMASMIEQKLVNAVGYEPFVLTRCKSEPMRSAAAKLMPESCCWKNSMRKLEPHRRAGAAGVGF